MFDPREKIALFIDGANLYAASKSLGFDIDYRKLLKAFQKAYAKLSVDRKTRGTEVTVDIPDQRWD